MRRYWIRVLIALVVCLPIGALDSAIALFLKPYTDEVVVAKNMDSPWYIPLVIVGFVTLQGVLTYASTYLNTWVAGRLSKEVRADLYDSLLKNECAFFDKSTSGEVMYRYNNAVDGACNGLIDNVRRLLTRIFSSISLVGVLLFNSWQLTIIAVSIMFVAVAPLAKVRSMLNSLMNVNFSAMFSLNTVYNETFSGNRTIFSYNLQEEQKRKFDGILNDIFNIGMGMMKKTAWITPFAHFMVSIGLGLAIALGSWLIVTERLTPGEFVSFLAALIMLYTPVKGLSNVAVSVQMSFNMMDMVFSSIDRKSTILNKDDALPLERVRRGITFEHVSFGYDGGPEILHDICLEVEAGKTLALVGNSGGGKSSIVSLIPRFYDVCKGAVKVDGIDVRDLRMEDLRRNIAFVFQDNFLFEGTIRENILLGNENATDEQLCHAVEGACLSNFLDSLEKGLDTEIGERGILLSGGQKQRVAIARAFIKDAPVIILDEATSALDNKSEHVVQQAINNLTTGKTVFVIAHRLTTVRNADLIAVINEGRLCELGSHDELISRKDGVYSSLYNMQFLPSAISKKEDL